MSMLYKMYFSLRTYLMTRRKLAECLNCKKAVYPRREVSVLNLILYVVIGVLVYLSLKSKACVFIPIVLAIIDSFLSKPRCPICKGDNLKIYVKEQK